MKRSSNNEIWDDRMFEQFINSEEYKKIINDLLIENKDDVSKDINKKLNDAIDGISNIYILIERNGLEEVLDETNKMLINISELLEFVDTTYDNRIPHDIESLYRHVSSKYRKLEFELYDYKFKKMEQKSINIENKINELNNIALEQKKTSNELLSKLEGMNATLLNMILTISIVTASVETISRISDPIYIPMFVLTISWLLLTCILFNLYFIKGKSKFDKFCLIIYSILTSVTFLCVLVTIYLKIK